MYNPSVYPQSGGYFVPASPNPPMQGVQSVAATLPIRRKDLLQSSERANMQALPSFAFNGSDLPSDRATLRFFYNLGHEHFQNLCSTFGMGPLMSMIDTQDNPYLYSENDRFNHNGTDQSCFVNDMQQMNIDVNKKSDTPNSSNPHNKVSDSLQLKCSDSDIESNFNP